MRPLLLTRAAPAALVFLTTLSLAGCASDRALHDRPAPQSPPPKPLAGDATLLDGRLRAEIRVGPLGFNLPDAVEGGAHPSRDRTGLHGNLQVSGHNGDIRPSAGASYDMGGASVGVGTGGASLGFGGRGGDRRGGRRDRADEPRGRGLVMPGGPLATIVLRFSNVSADKLVFRVADFLSPLGNFVVKPDTFSLAPGESIEAEPMTTQLGGGLEEVAVTLALRTLTGTAKQTIALRPATPADSAPKPRD